MVCVRWSFDIMVSVCYIGLVGNVIHLVEVSSEKT